ncbi:MAG: hypothetical protein R6V41_03035 [Desulfobacteraceae bacterium]
MRIRKTLITGVLATSLLLPAVAFAHTPMCSCFSLGDGTITCEGGFSDGSSASGTVMRVKDKKGNVLVKGKMDEFSEFTFEKPDQPFVVEFDAGSGHKIEIKGKDIAE